MTHDFPDQRLSIYPALPPPVQIRLVDLTPHVCSYFPDRIARMRAFLAGTLDPNVYHGFLDSSFRRSGSMVYQPICPGCRACQQMRIPVEQFQPTKSQRRSMKRNSDLLISVDRPKLTAEKFDLYARYVRDWHESKEPPTEETLREFLYDSPVETVEMEYRTPAGQLIGVSICDLSDTSLSSVYFYFDPLESARSLGTYSILREIAFAREMKIPYLYLGYAIYGCAKMEYKMNFRPFEILGTDGLWRSPEPLP